VDGLINELDEYAIEEGLQIAEAQRAAGGEAEVTILTMGPEKAAESIRARRGRLVPGPRGRVQRARAPGG
jgi:electron transfer flavoprotein alpha/beta subunit